MARPAMLRRLPDQPGYAGRPNSRKAHSYLQQLTSKDRHIDILLEFLLSGIFDVLLELVYQGFWASRDARGRAHPAFGGLGLIVLGGIAGGLTTLVLPTRILGAPALPGASLVISPLLNGGLMHFYGSWRVQQRLERSLLATFWGGALFAFGFALVRLATVTGP